VVNPEPVSTTVKPVTHWADVAVNRASMKGRGLPLEAMGMLRNAEQMRIEKV
jgi:hypothetical protein